MKYAITKQYTRGPEASCAEFDDLNAARAYINEKLAEDFSLNIKITYRIYRTGEMVEQFNPGNPMTSSSGSQNEAGDSQGKEQTASFRPTPFNTTPRPPGTPPKWIIDQEEDEKGKNK
ncbi:hypothetical protein [Aquicella lusitana]|uniref:Uncharacterized protein n=1 Tax=Aquicella lusitana TaxID=254246 RepID=A0A370GLG6_9COXI|nr:hypothetical protein [Aquicella lusitana]RDI44555.1 hypothetical protein C8D86_10937 [Aquicella lusitana]VVC72503.1 hypothetical protein AQULUS_02150 [Aquicella lusitana]